jgi:hypothetical protein
MQVLKKKWLWVGLLAVVGVPLLITAGLSIYEGSKDAQRAQALSNGTIALYLYDGTADLKSDKTPACNESSLKETARTVGLEQANMAYAIAILLSGDLTEEERGKGFVPLFPSSIWRLSQSDFTAGVLTLSFERLTEGEDRCSKLAGVQLEKTLTQFPSVTDVRFEPTGVFE